MTVLRVPSKNWLLGVLLVGPFMAQADATIANVATPSIHADLGASGAALELVIGGYLITFAVLVITGARLGQTYGYRRVYLLGIGGFGLASLLCGLAPNPTVLVLARVLQGGGAALMFPQTLTGIQLNFDGDHRKRAIGLYALALSGGGVVGQILGGALISADIAGTQWRAIFLVNIPIAAAVIAAGLRYLPADHHHTARRIDLPGIATLSAAILLVVLPLVLGRTEGWPVWAWICLAASAPAFLLFLAVEKRVDATRGSPLVNVTVLGQPPVYWALLTLLAATGTYYALLFTLAQYLQQGLGNSPFVSGLVLVPWVAAFGLAGQLVRRLPPRLASPAAGCLLLAASYLAITITWFAGAHLEALLVVLLGMGGLGLGIQFSALIRHLTTAVPAQYASDISGVSTTTMQIGGAISVAAFGTLYLSLTTPADSAHAFAVTTAALAAAALLSAATAHRATRPSTHSSTPSAAVRDHQPIPSDIAEQPAVGREGVVANEAMSRNSPIKDAQVPRLSAQ